ncbi:ribonuclease P protein component, partial [Lysobacter sp. 2RAB21]
APRLGLAVSRKVDPHAVGRNRIKRVLRDAFRHVRAELAGGDYVVVARPGASRCSGEELRVAFHSLLKRGGTRPALALPATAAPGTMPAASPS